MRKCNNYIGYFKAKSGKKLCDKIENYLHEFNNFAISISYSIDTDGKHHAMIIYDDLENKHRLD